MARQWRSYDVKQAHRIPETSLSLILIPHNMAFTWAILTRRATNMVSLGCNNNGLHKLKNLKAKVYKGPEKERETQ